MENNQFQESAENYLKETIAVFESYKKQAEKAFAQISDVEFFETIDGESNSVAAIAKHIGGNLRSRWTQFLTTDGEKLDRDRDAEFVAEKDTRRSVLEIWETGWQALFATLKSLAAEDLNKIVLIRTEKFTVMRALIRSLTHTASHVGQIIFLAKHLRAEKWQTLSIPRHKSAEYNRFLEGKENDAAEGQKS